MRVHARALCGHVLVCVVEGDVLAEGRGALVIPVRSEAGGQEGRLVERFRELCPGLARERRDGRPTFCFDVPVPWGAVVEVPARGPDGAFDGGALIDSLTETSWAGFQDVGVPVLGKNPATAEALAVAVVDGLSQNDCGLLSSVSLWTDSAEKAARLAQWLRERVRTRSLCTPSDFGVELVRWWLNLLDTRDEGHCVTLNAVSDRPFMLGRGVEGYHGNVSYLFTVDHQGRACDVSSAGELPQRPTWRDLRVSYETSGALEEPLRTLGIRPDRLERGIVPTDRGARARALDLLVRLGRRWGGSISTRLRSLIGGGSDYYYAMGGVRIACTSFDFCDRAAHLRPVPDGAPDALLVAAIGPPDDWSSNEESKGAPEDRRHVEDMILDSSQLEREEPGQAFDKIARGIESILNVTPGESQRKKWTSFFAATLSNDANWALWDDKRQLPARLAEELSYLVQKEDAVAAKELLKGGKRFADCAAMGDRDGAARALGDYVSEFRNRRFHGDPAFSGRNLRPAHHMRELLALLRNHLQATLLQLGRSDGSIGG